MQYSFFDAENYDRLYNSADWARYFGCFIGNGIFAEPADGMQVYSKGGMALGVRSGRCFINGYTGYADGTDAAVLDYGGSGTYRYDAVAARLDLRARDIHIEVLRGDEADSFDTAVKPSPVREGLIHDIILAYAAVGEGVTQLSDAQISDVRQNDELCGIVAGLIEQISAGKLFAQYEAMWELLKAGCAQDAEAVITAWSALNAVKTVNGLEPENGNISLTQSLVPSDDTAYQMPYYIQSGTVSLDSDSQNGVSITFPKAFKSAPIVLAAPPLHVSASNSSYFDPTLTPVADVTATGFKLYGWRVTSSSSRTSISSSTAANWIAFGKI